MTKLNWGMVGGGEGSQIGTRLARRRTACLRLQQVHLMQTLIKAAIMRATRHI